MKVIDWKVKSSVIATLINFFLVYFCGSEAKLSPPTSSGTEVRSLVYFPALPEAFSEDFHGRVSGLGGSRTFHKSFPPESNSLPILPLKPTTTTEKLPLAQESHVANTSVTEAPGPSYLTESVYYVNSPTPAPESSGEINTNHKNGHREDEQLETNLQSISSFTPLYTNHRTSYDPLLNPLLMHYIPMDSDESDIEVSDHSQLPPLASYSHYETSSTPESSTQRINHQPLAPVSQSRQSDSSYTIRHRPQLQRIGNPSRESSRGHSRKPATTITKSEPIYISSRIVDEPHSGSLVSNDNQNPTYSVGFDEQRIKPPKRVNKLRPKPRLVHKSSIKSDRVRGRQKDSERTNESKHGGSTVSRPVLNTYQNSQTRTAKNKQFVSRDSHFSTNSFGGDKQAPEAVEIYRPPNTENSEELFRRNKDDFQYDFDSPSESSPHTRYRHISGQLDHSFQESPVYHTSTTSYRAPSSLHPAQEKVRDQSQRDFIQKDSNIYVPEEYSIDGIPGIAGVDYPKYVRVPETSFKCSDQEHPGLYADKDAECQVFHICQEDGREDSFLCPVGTVFNQRYFVCDWWYNFPCNSADSLYSLNAFIYQVPERSEVYSSYS